MHEHVGKGSTGRVIGISPSECVKVSALLQRDMLDSSSLIEGAALRYLWKCKDMCHLIPLIKIGIEKGSHASSAVVKLTMLRAERTLRAFIQSSPIEVRMASIKRHLCQILACLRAMHNAGVVHGDMKSANVVVDSAANVRVIDLGSAHFLDKTTRLNGLCTYAYASPESFLEDKCARFKELDAWSVGIMTYFYIHQHYPMDENLAAKGTFDEFVTQHRSYHVHYYNNWNSVNNILDSSSVKKDHGRPLGGIPETATKLRYPDPNYFKSEDVPDVVHNVMIGLLQIDVGKRLSVETALQMLVATTEIPFVTISGCCKESSTDAYCDDVVVAEGWAHDTDRLACSMAARYLDKRGGPHREISSPMMKACVILAEQFKYSNSLTYVPRDVQEALAELVLALDFDLYSS